MRRFMLTTVFALAAAAAPAQTPPPAGQQTGRPAGTAGSDPSGTTARASIKDAKGATIGDATLRETAHGVLLQVELRNAPPGEHGFHIHENGTCTAPTFESAGNHWSPEGKAHGFLEERGPHAGDLPNIHVPQDGRLTFELLVEGVTLSPGARSLFDANGSALVLHASPDDYASQPSGAAGDRLACGVVMKS
jgi:Cu-Zn family superoxide dismutase